VRALVILIAFCIIIGAAGLARALG